MPEAIGKRGELKSGAIFTHTTAPIVAVEQWLSPWHDREDRDSPEPVKLFVRCITIEQMKRLSVLSCVHRSSLQAVKVGIREFREKLADFLEADQPVAITRHGETVGFYIPTRRKVKDEDLAALRTAAARLDAMIEASGASEEDLVADFGKTRRKAPRR